MLAAESEKTLAERALIQNPATQKDSVLKAIAVIQRSGAYLGAHTHTHRESEGEREMVMMQTSGNRGGVAAATRRTRGYGPHAAGGGRRRRGGGGGGEEEERRRRIRRRRGVRTEACAAPSGKGSLERFPQVRVRKASHRRLELLIEAAVANERYDDVLLLLCVHACIPSFPSLLRKKKSHSSDRIRWRERKRRSKTCTRRTY